MDDSEDKTLNIRQPVLPAAPGGAFEKGKVLVSKYKVIAPLGSGGMGTVYRVQHILLNKEFALKTLDSQKISDIAMMRFQTEARAASLLDHPNLVKVHDFGLLENGEPFLVMDMVHGVTLADRLEESGPMDIETAARLFAQVCLGLSYAHDKGVVHRDMKPSNIMLVDGAEIGAEGSVKVVDFGIAKLTASEDGTVQALTRTGEIFGSPLYMSPEQCSGASVDYRSDIYSVGCVLFEALTGAPPHLGQNALTTMLLHQSETAAPLSEASLGKAFPVALEQIVAKMLKKIPTERYSNIGLVALDLSAIGGESAKTPSRFASAPPTKAPASKNKSALSLGLSASAFGVAIAAGLVGYELGQNSPQLVAPVVQAEKLQEPSGPLEGFMSGKAIVVGKNMAPIQSRLRKRNGTFERVFSFPSIPLGTVRWPVGNSFVSRWAHEEDVFMPAGTSAIFEVDALKFPALIDNPAAIWRINPTEFTGLTIKGARLLDAETAKTILKAASTWTGLESLKLQDVPGDPSVLEELNNFKNLRELRLAHPINVDPHWLADQPFFMRQENLDLSGFDASALINKESQSYNLVLRSLTLEDSNVAPGLLKQLRQCQGLITIVLDVKTLSDQQIEALTRIEHLVTILFKSTPPDERQLNMLLANPHIMVYLSEKYSNPARRIALKKLYAHRIKFGEL